MNAENAKAQMRKGILEYCILTIIAEGDAYASDILNKLKEELDKLGLEEVTVTKWGYVLGTLKTNQNKNVPSIALIGHVDTSPDVSGENVNPQIHQNYNGTDIVLSQVSGVVIKVAENPYHIGWKYAFRGR